MAKQSNKVIPVRVPGRERRRWQIFLGALAVIILVLAFFVVEGGRNWDTVHRFFSYGTTRLHFTLDTAAETAGAASGRLITASNDGITAYTQDGTVDFMVTSSMDCPVLLNNSSYTLAYDAGGEDMLLLNRRGDLLLQQKTHGTIFDADLASDGSACYVAAGDRSRSVLQVYDREQLPCYTVNSASHYFSGCAVAPGADFVCAIAMGQEDGLFASTAVIYRTDREEPVARISLGNQLIYDVIFWSSSRLCAVGESAVVVFNTSGEVLGTVACEGLRDFNLHGTGFGAFLVPAEVGNDLITVNDGGRIVGRLPLGETIPQLEVSGKYVALLMGSDLTITGQKLETWYHTEELGAYTRACISSDGCAYLLTSNEAMRYLP